MIFPMIPEASGLYFVGISGDDLVPIDHNPSRRDVCIRVNRLNSKFGQARNLKQRYRSYQRSFGAARVDFQVLLLTRDTEAVERDMKNSFGAFRMRGRTGRLHEWLHGIDPRDALRIAHEVCARHGATDRASDALGAEALTRPSRERQRRTEFDVGPVDGAEIVKALDYLHRVSLPKELIVRLHHSEKPSETVSAALTYFTKHRNARFGARNRLYGHRLIFVASQHGLGRGTLHDLCKRAIQNFPA
ncbi:hypothetical protein [Paracoccus salsus]|uniref:hypothetical protein n=1 Tax=Paracoccus salsus TaxID=2911061 RepID=UPI001F2F4683|nr:hypothetical protein [Paracoccus salsus]MCF3972317.1 hypothetical protein [Paracoccus salsus]